MTNTIVSKNRNAAPSAFGWDFQINSAIIIMLKNIYNAIEVKIEGITQDIEVYLADGGKIFAQAKACMNPDDASNALRDLTGALESLADSQKEQPNLLLFVTNRTNPFNNINTIRRFAGAYSNITYTELPETCKKIIEEKCKHKKLSINKNLLSILVFDFSGDGENRYRIVKQEISEFLAELDSSYIGFSQKLLDRWHLSFGENASQNDRQCRITKKEMIWPLIVWLCEKGTNEKLMNFDEATSENISFNYTNIINETSERFEFISKVTNEYAQYEMLNKGLSQKEITESFIIEKSRLFYDEFDLSDIDKTLAETVIKLTVEKVLRERYYIIKIKKAVNIK